MSDTARKIVLTFLFAAIAVSSYFSWVNRAIEMSFMRRIDQASERYLDESLKRAVYTFAVVRGINGVISVIQNTTASFSPAGMGVNVAFGEILDPVNDLVERFSWVMLISSTSLGIQKVLAAFGRWFGFDILLALAMVALSAGLWARRVGRFDIRGAGVKLLVFAVVVRFCVPFASLAGDRVYDLFLKDTYDDASRTLDELNEELKKSEVVSGEDEIPENEPGLIDELKRYYKGAENLLEVKGKIAALKRKMAEYADYTVDLIIVFVLQTVVFPVGFLWMLARAGAHLAGKGFPPDAQDRLCRASEPPGT